MLKKSTLTLLTLAIVTALVFTAFGCNNQDVYPSTTPGFTVSGKITIDGNPAPNVKVLVDGGGDLVTNENGVFSAVGLDKGDVITFALDGYVFYPDSLTVKEDVYDLRVEGYADTSSEDDDTNSDGSDSDNGNQDDGDNNGQTPSDDYDVVVDETKVYDITNASLLFENGLINIVFCIESGFDSLSVNMRNGNSDTAISVTEANLVGEFSKDDTTYLQYKINVTTYVQSSCVFTILATNNQGVVGALGEVEYCPTSRLNPAVISLSDTTLNVLDCDERAVHYLMINGLVVGKIERSADLSAYLALERGVVTVSVLSVKAGCLPACSNTISFTLEEIDYDSQTV